MFDIKSQLFYFQFFVVMFAIKNNKKNFDQYEIFINENFELNKIKRIRNQ